jgi:two-component system response regulator AtoC
MTTKMRILIVEDEENIRTALRRWFVMRGFDADEAGDGLEAIELCRQNRYDIITMDLEMPRMSGTEAIPLIRQTHPVVPIVILTGYVHEARELAQTGAARILTKPTPLRELEKAVLELVSKSA